MEKQVKPRLLVVDVARFGNETTSYFTAGVEPRVAGRLPPRVTMNETVGRIADVARRNGVDWIVLDETGVGYAVRDCLAKTGVPVL